MTDKTISGGCLCGAVELTLTPPTLFASHCHCATCRRAHAAPMVTWTAVPESQIKIVVEDDALQSYASSDGVARLFCGDCGSQVAYHAEATPGRVYVPVAVLDGLDREIDSHVSYEERAPWLEGVELLPCFRAKGEDALDW